MKWIGAPKPIVIDVALWDKGILFRWGMKYILFLVYFIIFTVHTFWTHFMDECILSCYKLGLIPLIMTRWIFTHTDCSWVFKAWLKGVLLLMQLYSRALFKLWMLVGTTHCTSISIFNCPTHLVNVFHTMLINYLPTSPKEQIAAILRNKDLHNSLTCWSVQCQLGYSDYGLYVKAFAKWLHLGFDIAFSIYPLINLRWHLSTFLTREISLHLVINK